MAVACTVICDLKITISATYMIVMEIPYRMIFLIKIPCYEHIATDCFPFLIECSLRGHESYQCLELKWHDLVADEHVDTQF